MPTELPPNCASHDCRTASDAGWHRYVKAELKAHGSLRRQISPVNGRVLEVLGHAIEYLADEYALSVSQLGTLDAADPRIEAIQILAALNREVYYACPEAEPLLQRIARWVSSSHSQSQSHSHSNVPRKAIFR